MKLVGQDADTDETDVACDADESANAAEGEGGYAADEGWAFGST